MYCTGYTIKKQSFIAITILRDGGIHQKQLQSEQHLRTIYKIAGIAFFEEIPLLQELTDIGPTEKKIHASIYSPSA